MNKETAKNILLLHGTGLDTNHPMYSLDTFTDRLRPYQGLKEKHFRDICEAMSVLSEDFNQNKIDQKLVLTLLDLSLNTRNFTAGPHEPMFHGKNFISEKDKKLLDRWLCIIESNYRYLLMCFQDWEVFYDLAHYVVDYDSKEDWSFIEPYILKALEDNEIGDEDDREAMQKALKIIKEKKL